MFTVLKISLRIWKTIFKSKVLRTKNTRRLISPSIFFCSKMQVWFLSTSKLGLQMTLMNFFFSDWLSVQWKCHTREGGSAAGHSDRNQFSALKMYIMIVVWNLFKRTSISLWYNIYINNKEEIMESIFHFINTKLDINGDVIFNGLDLVLWLVMFIVISRFVKVIKEVAWAS